jgi:hypothetical protein
MAAHSPTFNSVESAPVRLFAHTPPEQINPFGAPSLIVDTAWRNVSNGK